MTDFKLHPLPYPAKPIPRVRSGNPNLDAGFKGTSAIPVPEKDDIVAKIDFDRGVQERKMHDAAMLEYHRKCLEVDAFNASQNLPSSK